MNFYGHEKLDNWANCQSGAGFKGWPIDRSDIADGRLSGASSDAAILDYAMNFEILTFTTLFPLLFSRR